MNTVKISCEAGKTDTISAFGQRISSLLFQHLKIYTGWSLFNMLVSLPFMIYNSDSLFYFMLMNFTWGLVNTGFAALFLLHIHAQRFRKKSYEDQMKIQRHICNMLFINIILDCGYILTGIFFMYFAQESALRLMFAAFGMAIIFQGLFLLVQDLWFYSRHRANLNRGTKIGRLPKASVRQSAQKC